MSNVVPFPTFSFHAPEPPPPAAELLAEIQSRGGRVFRTIAPGRVFCLTNSAETAAWLLDLGARGYSAPGLANSENGYLRARNGVREWDLYIHTIPVEGDLWEACER
jgi:hypothetical protein